MRGWPSGGGTCGRCESRIHSDSGYQREWVIVVGEPPAPWLAYLRGGSFVVVSIVDSTDHD